MRIGLVLVGIAVLVGCTNEPLDRNYTQPGVAPTDARAAIKQCLASEQVKLISRNGNIKYADTRRVDLCMRRMGWEPTIEQPMNGGPKPRQDPSYRVYLRATDADSVRFADYDVATMQRLAADRSTCMSRHPQSLKGKPVGIAALDTCMFSFGWVPTQQTRASQ